MSKDVIRNARIRTLAIIESKIMTFGGKTKPSIKANMINPIALKINPEMPFLEFASIKVSFISTRAFGYV